MIRIGTRGYELAVRHANLLSSKLGNLDTTTSIAYKNTIVDKPNSESAINSDSTIISREKLEQALLNHEIDVAIHNLADLPTSQTEGLIIAGVSERSAVNDLLILKKDSVDDDQTLNIKKDALIGTSSIRRRSFLKKLNPGVRFTDIAGNVSEKLQTLLEQDLDGIILAKGHVEETEIDLSGFHIHVLNPIEFVPAPAQGVYAYQTRKDDIETRKMIHQIHNSEVSSLTNVERTVLKLFGGSNKMALGVYCSKDANSFYHCYGMYSDSLDKQPFFHRISQSTTHKLAERMYQALSINHK